MQKIKIHNNLKKFPITRTKWFHRTTENSWKKIQEEGTLWGKTQAWSKNIGWHEGRRYTYLSSIDWGETYGSVLLEVNYQITGLSYIDNCNFEDETVDHKNEVDQFSVFIPMPISRCKRIN